MDNQKKAGFLVLLISLVLAFACCTASSDKKVDLPETDRIDSIELQFSDDSCTVSKIVSIDGKDKDTITELIRTTCKKWRESVNDNPQEVPYVIVNFHTVNQDEDRSLYVYRQDDQYYVEQPYRGRWTTTEELFDLINSYAEKNADHYSTKDITADNVTEIEGILKSAGLSNSDVFEEWVTDTSNINENTGESGFSDADCRMTVMLLAGDSISYDSVNDKYDGDYLMFDIDAIDNKEEYSMLRDKEKLFTTMFGETPYSGGGFADALPDNWKKHGIVFNNEKCSIISIVFKTYDKDEAYVGHTGILIDCQDIADADAKYVFIEKLAFRDPFKVTKLNDKADLIEMLSERSDYTVEEGEPAPAVYENDKQIGELKR